MPKRILIIEDDASISEVVAIILEQEKYRVEKYSDDSFMAGLEQDMPGLILLDMLLSGINGKHICLQLKHHHVFRHIPVIIMSANRDIQMHAEEACADDYLSKPFDMDRLISMVDKFMTV